MSVQQDTEQRLLGSMRYHLLITVVVVAFLLGGLGLWVATSTVSGAVVATGKVVVESNVKEVQHQAGGIIQSIKVKNGDLVLAGDLLLTLDDTLVRANQAMVVKQLHEFYAQQSRLLAEQMADKEITFSRLNVEGPVPELVKLVESHQQKLFYARRNSLQDQRNQFKQQISQLQQKIIGLRAGRDTKQQEMALVEPELADLLRLFKRQMIDKSRIRELQRDSLKLQGADNALMAEIVQDQKAISELEMKILQLDEDRRVEILQQLQDTRLNIVRLQQERVAVQDQLMRLQIRAPRSGYVHQLAFHTVGGVIAPGETVMSLVPQQDLLLVEAEIHPIDIDQLVVGQEARIRLPSFDQRTTPELRAQLQTISADLLQNSVTGLMYYQARLTIPEAELDKLHGKSLVPGMPVEVFATTQNRTVLSYLLKPIHDQIAHALRER